jgi:hypothetical protein
MAIPPPPFLQLNLEEFVHMFKKKVIIFFVLVCFAPRPEIFSLIGVPAEKMSVL